MFTTTEEVTTSTTALSKATAVFTPITGPLRDDDIQKNWKTTLEILLNLKYDGETDSLTGIVHSTTKCNKLFRHSFDHLGTAISDPNKMLRANIKTNNRLKADRIYTNSKRRQRLVRAAEKGRMRLHPRRC